MKKLLIILSFFLLGRISLNGQFVVSDPAALQALERANAVQIKDFTETVRSGQSLMQIQGMQKDMVEIYKKSEAFVQDMTMFIQIGERLVALGTSFEKFKPYENYFSQNGRQVVSQIETVKSLYYMVESLINSCTKEGLTPGDRVTMLTEVNSALNEIIRIIESVKQVISNGLKNNAMNKMYNGMIYKSGGWGKMSVSFGSSTR